MQSRHNENVQQHPSVKSEVFTQAVSRCECVAELWQWVTAWHRQLEQRWMRSVHFSSSVVSFRLMHFILLKQRGALPQWLSRARHAWTKVALIKKLRFQCHYGRWHADERTHSYTCTHAARQTEGTLLNTAGANCEYWPLCVGAVEVTLKSGGLP